MSLSPNTQHSPLTLIELDLHQVGYDTQFVPANENPAISYEQLYVLLEKLGGERLLMAQLVFANDIVKVNAQKANQEIPRMPVSTLQIMVALPLPKDKSKLSEMATLVGVLNQYVLAGNFGVNEAEGFYFRATMMGMVEEQIDTYLLVMALESTLAQIKRFLPDLAALAFDKAPLSTILKKVKQKAQ